MYAVEVNEFLISSVDTVHHIHCELNSIPDRSVNCWLLDISVHSHRREGVAKRELVMQKGNSRSTTFQVSYR